MKTTTAASLVITSSIFSSILSASVTMDWVTVGNAGNAADTTGYGAVAYEYRIGKYEVTNAQYGTFLNAAAKTDTYGLYNSNMSSYGITRSGSSGSYTYSVSSTFANRPVVYVSWFDAARFANWMMNGQSSGSTETGAYTLNGATSGVILANAAAQVYIPTENEWYKAAYHDPVGQGYYDYPTPYPSIYHGPLYGYTMTSSDANFENNVGSSTDVGTYSADPSSYGTYDQGGNVWEWNDAVIFGSRGRRGGSWSTIAGAMLSESAYNWVAPMDESSNTGFRVASVIPEPSALLLSMLASGVMLIRRKR